MTTNVLMLATGSDFSYRVLKTAHAAGPIVHVLGSPRASALLLSRYPASVTITHAPVDAAAADMMVAEINRLTELKGITCVMPSDPPTTRFLIAVASRLNAPTFPAPDLATFDMLNDKWRFTAMMGDLGLPCPRSRYFADREALLRAYEAGELPGPAIVKPLAESGGLGVQRIPPGEGPRIAKSLTYAPLIWQEFIAGVDLDVTAFCRNGRLITFSTRRRSRGEFLLQDHAELRRQVTLLAERHMLTGIFDFDVVTDPTFTRFHWIECNPRVFFSIDYMAYGGMNLVAEGLGLSRGARLGLHDECLEGAGLAPGMTGQIVRVRKLRAVLRGLLHAEPVTAGDLSSLARELSDPVFYLLNRTSELWKEVRTARERIAAERAAIRSIGAFEMPQPAPRGRSGRPSP